jgi:WD40 repeat protein
MCETNEVLCTVRGHTDVVRSVCFSSDGKELTSGSEHSTVRNWNPATREACRERTPTATTTTTTVMFRALRNKLQYCIAYLASGAARPVLRERERERERERWSFIRKQCP